MKKKRIAVLISGRGTNLGAIARAAMNPDFPAEIALVLSNRPHVAGLELALEEGIPIKVIDHKEFDDRQSHELAVCEALKSADVELICLAGYMRILEGPMLSAWQGKIVNIHPSLLPSFRGVDTHARALDAGVRWHGCTVHFLSAALDAGPIISQGAVPVLPDDDVETLSSRVLEMEHRIYPKAIELVLLGKVRWSGDRQVLHNGESDDDVCMFTDLSSTSV